MIAVITLLVCMVLLIVYSPHLEMTLLFACIAGEHVFARHVWSYRVTVQVGSTGTGKSIYVRHMLQEFGQSDRAN